MAATERKINFIIPMAGLGRRFSQAGVRVPKFMVEAGGLTLFEHSLRSLPLSLASRVVFIALREHEEQCGVSSFIRGRMASLSPAPVEIIILDKPTRGQAETVLAAKALVPPEEEAAIFNIDTAFVSSTLEAKLSGPEKRDGVIGAFVLDAKDNKWSFAEIDGSGIVLRTAEKVQISRYALTGLYHFTRAGDFFDCAGAAVAGGELVSGEYYVAPLYNRLIARGKKFTLDVAEKIIPLGTPEDVARYDSK